MTEIHLPLFAWLLLALAGAVVVYVVIRLIVPLYSGLPGPYVLIAGGAYSGAELRALYRHPGQDG